MLKLNKVTLQYDQVKVVANISFEVKKGQRLVIVGASGCGKTTLLKAIAGFMPISKGNILFDNKRIIDPTEQLVPGHDSIKLVNQDFSLDLFHTVKENIRLKLLKFDKDYIDSRVVELLKLTELTKFKNFKAKYLSGGQKQRLSIARALADEPELLLLDEPFNQLDYHLKLKIEEYIFKYLNKYNITSILVTHNGEEAMRWANRILFMKKGKLERIDTSTEFYNKPRNKYEAAFFGEINTVLVNNKEVCFRPHEFSKKEKTIFNLNLKVNYVGCTNKGWFVSNQFQVGKRKINLYSNKSLIELKDIWVKAIKF